MRGGAEGGQASADFNVNGANRYSNYKMLTIIIINIIANTQNCHNALFFHSIPVVTCRCPAGPCAVLVHVPVVLQV